MENNEILRKLGLTKNASLIYLALLEDGPSLISQISRKTNLHRPMIYRAIKELENHGLISVAPRGKQKRYVAEAPERLETLIGQLKGDFEKFMPAIKHLYENRSNKPVLRFFEGKEGITALTDDLVETLKKGEIYYRYSSRKAETEALKYFSPKYIATKNAKDIQRFVISNPDFMNTRKPDMNRIVKAIPAKYGLFDYNIVQFIYGNKVGFIDYDTEVVIIIEHPTIAEFQKKIFKAFFDLL